MQYRIYRNLRKKCWSVQEKVDGKWKVTKHLTKFAALNCTFKVSESGRQRVILEKRKNVRSWVYAKEIMLSTLFGLDFWRRLSYNPYKSREFMCEGELVQSAELIAFEPDAAFLPPKG